MEQKQIILISKNLNGNINLELNKKNKNEKNNEKDNENTRNENIMVEPNFTQIKYFDNSQQIKSLYIYDNFEIISKNIIKNLFNIKNVGKNFNECTIIDNYILINFSNNFNENNKSISMIGILNNENIFIKKYILIYEKDDQRNDHLKEIKSNLNKYLNELSLLNNSSPITNNKYDIIGTIIKYDENQQFNNNNINYEQIDNNNNNIINDNSFIPDYQISNLNQNVQINSLDSVNSSIKNHFNSCPKIGLQNIGATCYMNSTLQCFCHIEKFINFFKYNPQIINNGNNNKDNLSSSFKLLIENLWPNNYSNQNKKSYYAPEEFKKKISKMNPLFEGIAANDSKDLVNFIIMTLHEELNTNANIETYNSFTDQTNQTLSFQNFYNEFQTKNKSIISDLFYAVNCNVTECGNCHIKIFNYQIYFFIVFPLEEIRKYKNQNNNYNNIITNEVNIYDCFNYDRRQNIMDQNNAMYCNYCKITCGSKMNTYLVTGPEILILLLNRGKGIEFNVKIYFEEYLNLCNYIEIKNTGFNYKLIGVITHIGESGMGGHFIAYCRDPLTEKWHKYNDAIVTDVNNFKTEVIDFAMPYLLFYQKSI